MRLALAGLLVGALLAVPALPSAGACRVDFGDPTEPRVSSSCTDPREIVHEPSLPLHAQTATLSALDDWEAPCEAERSLCGTALEARVSAEDPDSPDRARLTLNATVHGLDVEPETCGGTSTVGPLAANATVC